jgi:deoxycytidylate deaminase
MRKTKISKKIARVWTEDLGDDLFFALTGPVGADLALVIEGLTETFKKMHYTYLPVEISDIIGEFPEGAEANSKKGISRKHDLMTAGNEICKRLSRGDALAVAAMAKIRDLRQEKAKSKDKPVGKCIFVIRSLKRRHEVEVLRKVYGSSFQLIGVHDSKLNRFRGLVKQFADGDPEESKYEQDAEQIIRRDEEEEEKGIEYGQDMRNTFPLADFFVDVLDKAAAKIELTRYVELLMGNVLIAPTRDESAMFHAYSASLRSLALGRQVGAAIANPSGDIVAVGTNDVPSPAGGLFWTPDKSDHRDVAEGLDSNDETKRFLVKDFLKRTWKSTWEITAKAAGVESKLPEDFNIEQHLDSLVKDSKRLLKGSRITSLIEFGRPVHAEMDAITTCARDGRPVKGLRLYSTTFPCHECTRHIIASGIESVIFIEPYAKSMALQLFGYAISLTREKDKIPFEPFVGIAPTSYADLFFLGTKDRKRDGKVLHFRYEDAAPRKQEPYYSYIPRESEAVASLSISEESNE